MHVKYLSVEDLSLRFYHAGYWAVFAQINHISLHFTWNTRNRGIAVSNEVIMRSRFEGIPSGACIVFATNCEQCGSCSWCLLPDSPQDGYHPVIARVSHMDVNSPEDGKRTNEESASVCPYCRQIAWEKAEKGTLVLWTHAITNLPLEIHELTDSAAKPPTTVKFYSVTEMTGSVLVLKVDELLPRVEAVSSPVNRLKKHFGGLPPHVPKNQLTLAAIGGDVYDKLVNTKAKQRVDQKNPPSYPVYSVGGIFAIEKDGHEVLEFRARPLGPLSAFDALFFDRGGTLKLLAVYMDIFEANPLGGHVLRAIQLRSQTDNLPIWLFANGEVVETTLRGLLPHFPTVEDVKALQAV